jgi:hypothetical protein
MQLHYEVRMERNTAVRLTEISDKLENNAQYAEAIFALRYAAFEGLFRRALIVSCRLKGWRTIDAFEVLSTERLSTLTALADTLKTICGTPKNELVFGTDARPVWAVLKSIEVLRNYFIHGLKPVDPKKLTQANKALSEILHNRSILFADVLVYSDIGHASIKLSDPLVDLRRMRFKLSADWLDKAELIRLFTANRFSPPSEPKLGEAQKWVNKIADRKKSLKAE